MAHPGDADSIGIVVNVRRMQPGLAPVVPCPLGARADEPHAGARRIEVNLPLMAENRFHILRGEEVRRTMRAIKNTDFPFVSQRREKQ